MSRVSRFAALLSLTWLVHSSCRESQPRADGLRVDSGAVVVRDSAGIRIVTNDQARWNASPIWPVETSPRTVVGSVNGDSGGFLYLASSAMAFEDRRTVVANGGTNEILVFDTNGQYLESIGRPGRGPGEFRRLRDVMRYRADSILATETGVTAHVFRENGAFGRVIRLEPVPGRGGMQRIPRIVGVFGAGQLLVRTGSSTEVERGFVGSYRDTIHASILDQEGRLLHRLGRFLGREMYFQDDEERSAAFWFSMPYPPETFLIAGDEHLYVVNNERYEIQVQTLSGVPEMLIRREHRPRHVTAEDIRRYREVQRARFRLGPERLQDVFLASLEDAMATIEDPEVFPAIRDAQLATDGNIWIREYAASAAVTDWTIFSPDGVIIGRARLPDEVTAYEQSPFEIGRDYVIGRLFGEANVERIAVFSIEHESERTP